MEQTNSQPILTIEGEKIALGPLDGSSLPLFAKWRNDFEITAGLAATWRITSWAATEKWFARPNEDETIVRFWIYEQATNRLIGFTSLIDIDRFNRRAEFVIAIGEKDCWGKGYATEGTALMLDYGFNWLCLHNIRLRVASFNKRAIPIYERVGFKVIGTWREAQFLGNRMYDEILMDCLATEFKSPVLQRYLPAD